MKKSEKMEEENNPSNNKLASRFIVVGVILAIISPYVFTRPNKYISFIETGDLGDTIGGLTAPIIGIMSAVLVYLALKEQVKANNIILKQFKFQTEINILNGMLEHFVNLFDNFHYKEVTTSGGNKDITEYRGYMAIVKYLQDLNNYAPDQHDNKVLFSEPMTSEFYSILNLATVFVNKVKNSQIQKQDKEYYLNLLNNYINLKIWPKFFTEVEFEEVEKCEKCQIKHGIYPQIIINELLEIRDSLDEIKTEVLSSK